MTTPSLYRSLMPSTYVQYLARHFDEPGAILRGTGIDREAFFASAAPITVAQHFACFANAAELSTSPDWYLEWATLLAETAHGPLTPALLAAPTLGEGIDIFLRYIPSRVPYLTWAGVDADGNFSCEIDEVVDLGAHRQWFIEIPLVVMYVHIRRMHPHAIESSCIELKYDAPPHSDRYEKWVACPVRFGSSRNAVTFPSSWRQTPNVGFDESSWLTARSRCESACKTTPESDTLAAVRRVLYAQLDRAPVSSMPTIDFVASKLHVSGRTLNRRLRALDTNYQTIADGILKERARELIGNAALTTSDVANSLGYHDVSTFRRTFKRWFGMSPIEFRRQLARD